MSDPAADNALVFDEDDDIAPEVSAEEQIQKLRKKLKASALEKKENLDGWQRARAELLNVKKAHSDEITRIRKHGSENLIMELLPVVDSFHMAMSNTEAWQAVSEEWRTGVEYIHQQLMDTLTSQGLAPVPTDGAFDPQLHESVEDVPTDNEKHDGMIASVVQPGYTLHDKLLRPAKVTVFNYQS